MQSRIVEVEKVRSQYGKMLLEFSLILTIFSEFVNKESVSDFINLLLVVIIIMLMMMMMMTIIVIITSSQHFVFDIIFETPGDYMLPGINSNNNNN